MPVRESTFRIPLPEGFGGEGNLVDDFFDRLFPLNFKLGEEPLVLFLVFNFMMSYLLNLGHYVSI